MQKFRDRKGTGIVAVQISSGTSCLQNMVIYVKLIVKHSVFITLLFYLIMCVSSTVKVHIRVANLLLHLLLTEHGKLSDEALKN